VAQTAANVTVVSGNGQVICSTCTNTIFRAFSQLLVKVTDASGNPIPNKSVTWSLVSYQGPLPFFATDTITDGNGIASTFFTQASQAGSFAQEYLQSVIQASSDGVTALFTETQGLSDVNNHQLQFINARLDSPAQGVTLQGTAGGTGTTQVKAHVDAFGIPIPNVSVRILTCPAEGCQSTASADVSKIASAACATGAGADRGSVLTDANGDATCTIIFGPVSGSNEFTVLVGGVDPAVAPEYFPGYSAVAYWQSARIGFTVTPGIPGLITVSSGAGQSVNPGQSTAPLVVKVTDATGVNAIAGAPVSWSVTPAGAATFNPASSSTDAQGQASTVATLASSAVGAIVIRATTGNLSTTLNVTANVTVTGLQKVSGDPQTAPANQPFSQPLIVQVNGSTGQPLANYPVRFAISGSGTLSSATATTDAAGRAQVTVTAGATPGGVTVTASAGAFSQSFSLTVIPPGPSLSLNGFVNGADFQRGALSPCSVATIIGPGIASTVQGVVVPGAIIGPLPYLLAGVKVSFGNSQAPIYNVANVNGQQQVTVQVPCDVTPGNVVVTVNVSGGSGTLTVPILPASPGVFLTTMSDGQSRLVAVRPDGSFVSIENPARRGEIIRAYVTGLGPVSPPIATNSIPVPGTDGIVTGQVIVGVNNQGTRLVQARLAPNLIGVYEVAFQVPSDASAGNDIVFSVGINVPGDSSTRFSGGTKIPIL
jgi:uncharacterized protein (TIGR03437 family)